MKKILCGQLIPLEKTTDFNPIRNGAPQCRISNWVKRRSSLTGLIIILILFLWCTKAWAPFPMTQMESGELKVDMPYKEGVIKEKTTAPRVEFSREEKRTQEPVADVSQSSPDKGKGEVEPFEGFFMEESQVEHKTSKSENKFIKPETVQQEEIVKSEKIKIAPLKQVIIEGAIVIFVAGILLTLIYLSRGHKR